MELSAESITQYITVRINRLHFVKPERMQAGFNFFPVTDDDPDYVIHVEGILCGRRYLVETQLINVVGIG